MEELLELINDDMKFTIDLNDNHTISIIQKLIFISNKIYSKTRYQPADTIICHPKMDEIISKYSESLYRHHVISSNQIERDKIIIYSKKSIENPFIIREIEPQNPNDIMELSIIPIIAVSENELRKYRSNALGLLHVNGFFKFLD